MKTTGVPGAHGVHVVIPVKGPAPDLVTVLKAPATLPSLQNAKERTSSQSLVRKLIKVVFFRIHFSIKVHEYQEF